MNKQIYDKIDEIFKDKNSEEFLAFKKDLTFNIKKSYNQMIQSGFSEYIAVAENLDSLKKIEDVIKVSNSVREIKEKLNEKNRFIENIDKTVNKDAVNKDYDDEYIENIKKIVEDAALDIDHLENTSIKEQNDEIVYKKDVISNDNTEKVNNNEPKNNSFDKKRYFTRLGTFIGVIGVTILVVALLHVFHVIG